MTLVSVIVAVYNCEPYIQQCIDSLTNQSYQNIEILICDDCSNDNTWNILLNQNDHRIKIFRNTTNSGVVISRNKLLRKTRGEYIVIQDGDDWSESTRIETLVNLFKTDPDLGLCGTGYFRVNNNIVTTKSNNLSSFYLSLDDCLNLPFMPATMMLHRKVYDQLGGYHPYFNRLYGEDLYWIIKIVENFKVYYLKDPLYYYRLNPTSITNTFDTPDKLIVMDLMSELISQRKKNGTDWIEKNDQDSIMKFKASRFNSKAWLSEKYRIAAAVQQDGGKRSIAIRLIIKALSYNLLSLKNYITLKYILGF